MSVVTEAPRGALPPPGFSRQSGHDRVKMLSRGQVGPAPIHHLTGVRITQVSPGACVLTMPASPWLMHGNGEVDTAAIADGAVYLAALTTVPPDTTVDLRVLTWSPLRFASTEGRSLIARARVVRSNGRLIYAVVDVEDADGRTLSHATGTLVARPIDPAEQETGSAAPSSGALRYATPDPYQRPLPRAHREAFAAVASWDMDRIADAVVSGEIPPPPIHELVGVEITGMAEGSLRPTPWLRLFDRRAQTGLVMASLIDFCFARAVEGVSAGAHWALLSGTMTWAAPLMTADTTLRIVTDRSALGSGDLAPVAAHLTTDEGAIVASLNCVGLVMSRSPARASSATRRVLCTVVFTDIVGSTRLADDVGDAEWRRLREQHDLLVRARVTEFGGTEVKSTGDGFLLLFDSPSAAVACAEAARQDVGGAGLEIRVGVNTGECEVLDGDVTGIGVNLAARIESAASPNSVWVSDTTRALVQGSDFTFTDEGERELHGFPEPARLWSLASA